MSLHNQKAVFQLHASLLHAGWPGWPLASARSFTCLDISPISFVDLCQDLDLGARMPGGLQRVRRTLPVSSWPRVRRVALVAVSVVVGRAEVVVRRVAVMARIRFVICIFVIVGEGCNWFCSIIV